MERRRLPGVNTRHAQQNINFLDRPIYLPHGRTAHISKYDDKNGFTARYPEDLGAPTAWDSCVLKVLLHKAQQANGRVATISNFTDFLRDLNIAGNSLNQTSKYRKMVSLALKRWAGVVLYFDQFYEGENQRIERSFPVLTYSEFKTTTGDIEVRFSEDFMKECVTPFTILQNVDKCIRLSGTPIAARLYDILCTKTYSMNRRGHWAVGLDKLFNKIGLNEIRHRCRKLERLEKGMEKLKEVMNVTYTVGHNDIVLFYFKEDD